MTKGLELFQAILKIKDKEIAMLRGENKLLHTEVEELKNTIATTVIQKDHTDIDTYMEWLGSEEADLLAQAYAEQNIIESTDEATITGLYAVK